MSVSVNTIRGYLGKSGANTHASAVACCMFEGDGAFQNSWTDWINNGRGYDFSTAVGNNMSSGIWCSFKFDPNFINTSDDPIDCYDSTSQTTTAYPSNNGGLWVSGTTGTMTSLTFTQGDGTTGGSLESVNPTLAKIEWDKPTKTGDDYETFNATSGKTIAFWYYLGTAEVNAFWSCISDNGSNTASNYSGITVQRPSNRGSAFTILVGDNTGTASSDRRSHLGVDGSLTADEWNFVVVRMIGGTTQSTTANYVNITTAAAGVRSTGNDGISGTSGTYSGDPIYSSTSTNKMRWFNQRGQALDVNDRIGQLWVLPIGLDADSTYLDGLYNETKTLYGG
tara:strand:+ start:131 stop:1144 length:1014 start_codon:yes stop_codon:yes gene_type:complete